MTFSYLGQPVTLNADVPLLITPASAQQLRCYVQTQSIVVLFHLIPLTPPAQLVPTQVPNASSSSPELRTLLSLFDHLFHEPTTLPPPRNITHHIHLLPNTNPVNIKPYRYPYYQKFELEKQVTSMLEASLIQPSRSPFSSPILLVKKKDGCWRCFVDYRALNDITGVISKRRTNSLMNWPGIVVL